MRRYPKYKYSGIEYIADIPQHWEAWKLKFLVKDKLKYGANEAAELEDRSLPRYIRITDFDNNGRLKDDTFKSLPYDIAKEYLLKNGDILFARSGATVGKTLLFDKYDGVACFAGYLIKACCNEQKMNHKFLDYYTSSSSYENWKDMIFIQSTIQNIGADKYNVLLVPKPTLPEQQSIIRFLDYKTGQIDIFITNRQKQIELLKEQKAATIYKAVTKGINPYVKMKPSGIEWIGEIPEHWELKTLRRITKEHRQGYYIDDDYIDDGVKLVRITDLHSNGSIDYTEMPFVKISKESEKIYHIQEGDFLFPRTGTIGSLGFVTKPKRAVFASYLIRFRFKTNEVVNEFLYFYFISSAFLEGLFSDLHGGVNQNIHAENIKNQFIAIPKTIIEQQAILDYIKTETETTDTLISKYQKQIGLMQEYRTSLISQAVTGKIDVRDWQPKKKGEAL